MRVAAVGDIMMGDSSHFLGRGVGTHLRRRDAADPFGFVRGGIESADLVFGNLESPLTADCGGNSWNRVYRGPAESARVLRLGRSTVLNTANNHSFDHGPDVAMGTRAILERAGISHIGGRSGASTRVDEVGICAGGLMIQFLATSVIRDRMSPAVDLSACARDICARLRAGTADVRIVSLHWGDEYVSFPSPVQIAAARAIVDAGAHLILGHHSHVLQPVVKMGNALVAFSLGNFLFDHTWTRDTQVGGILDVDLDPSGVQSWNFSPTRAGSDFSPRPVAGPDADWALQIVQAPVLEDERAYRAALTAATRRHRLAMKVELLRNLPRVSLDTWHFLLTKRRRSRHGLVGVGGKHGR
jgi:poly-gamma-glutamate synthesis protein (capsule biosynthesis protein)